MDYLIGEIGISLLVAFLLGCLIAWIMSRLFGSRAIKRERIRQTGIIRQRDQEIRHLRSGRGGYAAGRGAPRGPARQPTSRGRAQGPSGVQTRTSGSAKPGTYSVAAKDKRGDSASLRVRPPQGSAGPARRPGGESTESQLRRELDDQTYQKIQAFASLGERDRQLQYSYNDGQSATTQTQNLSDYQRLLKQKNNQVDELQRKVRDLINTQSSKTVETGGSSIREKQLQSRFEDESYEKIKALAGWGEAERKLSLMPARSRSSYIA